MISSPQPSRLVLFDSRRDVRDRCSPECATFPVSLVAAAALLLVMCAGPPAPITVAVAAPTTAFNSAIANTGPNPSTQYVAEYAAHCDAATIGSYATAVTACGGLGRGWALATVPSAAAQSAIIALSTNVMWLAGSDAAIEGEWRWTTGRLTNTLFYRGQYNAGAACSIAPCSCEPGAFCNWRPSPAEPNDSAGSEDYSALAPSGWNDVTASASSIVCAACERSLCTLALDCNATNTLFVNTSKYFVFGEPCGCVCKDGFTGPRCDSPIVPVNTGAYIAEFGVTCNAATIFSYATAVTACAGLGSGWALATVPSAAAQSAIANISSDHMWLAGSDAAIEGEWRWTTGRLTSTLFYKGQYAGAACSIPPCSCEAGAYCNWNAASEPNNSAGDEDYMMLISSVVSPSRQWNDLPASGTVTCAACERSLCTLALDCNAANTLSVNTSKYFVFGEPCGCVCKDGFTGPRCDSPIVPVNTGAYIAEFGVTCNAATIFSYATAVTACAGLGRGWALATVPSAAAQTAVANISTTDLWLAGSDAAIEGEWRWTAGRLTNTLFYRGQYNAGAACSIPPCSCEAGAYCNWFVVTSEPNDSLGDEDFMVMMSSYSSLRQWNDLPASAPMVACAACERSLCTLALDCNAANTLSVNTSKYFVFGEPCGCVCKDGFSGPRCDDAAPVVSVNAAYVSQFMGECASEPLSWTEAAVQCSARGSGWALATVNSAAAQTAVAALLPELATWIGGHDLAVNGAFVWQFGRLQGQTFYTGLKVPGTTTCAAGPCASPAGMYNNFNAFQPDDAGGVESYVMMVPSKTWNDAPHLYSTTRCYACERSPCLDVTVASAAAAALVAAGGSTSGFKFSAYYPNCTGTVSPSVSKTAATSLSVVDSITSSPALSTSRSRAISASLSPFFTRSTSYRPSSTNEMTVSAPTTASILVPKTATVALPPPATTTQTIIATTAPSATTATDTMSATTTSAVTTSTSSPEASTETTTTAVSGTSAAPSSTTSITESSGMTTATAAVQTATAPIATSSANCSATPAGGGVAASSATTLVLFPLSSNGAAGASTTNTNGGSGYVLSFPLPSSIPLAIAATANTPFTLVWNVTSGGTQGEEALTQTLRNHVVMFVQCTAPPSGSQAAAVSLLIRCSMPPFSVPEATVAAAPVRVTMTAAISNTVLLPESACPASAPTTLLLVATMIVAPTTAGGDTTAAATVLRVALAASGIATTAFAILVEPWALEPLLLVGVLDGPCAGLAGLQTMARFAVYSLNPFVPLTNSPSAGGLLLILLVGVVAVINAAVAYVRTPEVPTNDGTAEVSFTSLEQPRWRRACGTALFPRVAFSVAVAAVTGVSWALATTIRDHATASSSSSQSLLFIVLGSVYVVLVPAVGALVVFRAAPATFLAARPNHQLLHTQSDASAVRRWVRRLVTPVGSFVPLLQLSTATGDHLDPNPSAALPPSSARHQNYRRADTQATPTFNTATTLHPSSRPQPMPQALNLRGVTAGPRGGSQLFAGSALLSVAVFAITAAPPLSSSCAARHYVAAAVLLLSAVLVAAVRPHRTPLATILTAALLALIGLCVALIGAASHRTQSEISSTATAVFALALVAMLVSVGRTMHALWLWLAYDRKPRHTTSMPEEDTKEMKLMIDTP